MGRRKKAVLIEENWHPEIEQWEKIINDPWYNYIEMYKEIKRIERKKKALTKPEHSPHPKTEWWETEYICFECGKILRIQRVMRNDVGYSFRNHIKRSSATKRK